MALGEAGPETKEEILKFQCVNTALNLSLLSYILFFPEYFVIIYYFMRHIKSNSGPTFHTG